MSKVGGKPELMFAVRHSKRARRLSRRERLGGAPRVTPLLAKQARHAKHPSKPTAPTGQRESKIVAAHPGMVTQLAQAFRRKVI